MKTNNILISALAFIGLVVVGAWLFRVFDALFWQFTYWVRYVLMPNIFYAIVGVLAIFGFLYLLKGKSS